MTDRHVHEWTRVPDGSGITAWACAECPETSATCIQGETEHPTGSSLLLCERCKDHADATLDRIARALELHQPPLTRPDGTRFRRDADGGPDAGDVWSQLWGWVARWSEHVGAANEGWRPFLKRHHIWAAHNVELSGWSSYWGSIHHLLWRARGEAGLLPHVEPEPCIHCGGEVVRDWSDDNFEPLKEGLSDRVRCTGCGMSWPSPGHWRVATRDWVERAPQERTDALVTLAQAHNLWPDVPVSTMRSWAVRSQENYTQGVERAHDWWATQPEVGPVTKPPSIIRTLPEHHRFRGVRHLADGTRVNCYDTEPRYRVGDLKVFVDERIRPGREGRPASERIRA